MSTSDQWNPRCPPPRDLVRPVPIDPDGVRGPTRGQAAGPRWRRTSQGLYVPATVSDQRPEQRILEASMQLRPDGALTGWPALRLAGGNYFDGLLPDGRTRRPVPMTIGPGHGRRSRDGIVWRQDRLDPAEVVLLEGIRCTRVDRALFDEMREAEVREAVVAVDMAAAAGQITIAHMNLYADAHPGWAGVDQVRRALPLASEDSRSPNETRSRLIWQLDAGLPRPGVNQPVWDLRGGLLGYADLLDEEAGMVGEFDGAAHRKARRHTNDVRREERFRRAGLEYVKITGLDLLDPQVVVERLLSTRGRALRNAVRPTWTTVAPPDWREDPSPADREVLHELWRGWERGTG